MEKVSVIVPCYNVEKYVKECLDSILNQTVGLENLEIILVDDCSKDGTRAILEEYEERYPDYIILIKLSENGKQGTARNIGLDYVSGDYVSFVDADDYISQDMYEVLLKVIRESESDIVEFRDFSDVNQTQCGNRDITFQVYDINDERSRKQLLLSNDVMGESCTKKLYRCTFLKEADVRFAEGVAYEEPLFTYPLKFLVNRVALVEGDFYFYRKNDEGTTLKYMSNPSTILDHLKVQWQLFDYIRGLPDYDSFREESELHFLHAFFAEPFYFLSLRGMIMPVSLFRYMCRMVKMVLPGFRDNIYVLHKYCEEESPIFDLISESDVMDDEMAAIRLGEIYQRIRGIDKYDKGH